MPISTRSSGDFESLFQYNRWASGRVLDTLQAVDEVPERALELFSHLLRSQDLWYGRVQETDHTNLDFWVTDSLSACARRLEASTERWQEVLKVRAPDDLDQRIAYTNSNGTPYNTPLRDILTHVVNHSTHHRAQIALVLRAADITPPSMDYIYYVRE